VLARLCVHACCLLPFLLGVCVVCAAARAVCAAHMPCCFRKVFELRARLPPTSSSTIAERGSIPTSGATKPFPVPYTDDFEGYPLYSEASYFADQAGSWEIVAASDLSHGLVMRQTVRSVVGVSSVHATVLLECTP
jgi:hypothetical protein